MSDRDHETPLDPRLRELIEDYREVPQALDAARRDRIFAAVQAQRATPRTRAQQRSRAPRRGTPRVMPWIAAAAVLVIGIGIGRVLPTGHDSTPQSDPAGSETARWSQETSEALYLLATRDYLARTTTLLTEFRRAAAQPTPELDATPGSGTVRWAGELLLETRLLLDSPASDNRRLATLLRDLELILAEIVQLADGASPREREILRKSLEQRSVFLRLQQEMPAPKGTRGA